MLIAQVEFMLAQVRHLSELYVGLITLALRVVPCQTIILIVLRFHRARFIRVQRFLLIKKYMAASASQSCVGLANDQVLDPLPLVF